jgi:hypothetical protein
MLQPTLYPSTVLLSGRSRQSQYLYQLAVSRLPQTEMQMLHSLSDAVLADKKSKQYLLPLQQLSSLLVIYRCLGIIPSPHGNKRLTLAVYGEDLHNRYRNMPAMAHECSMTLKNNGPHPSIQKPHPDH